MKFTKPATSVDEQLALLRRRGLRIDDEAEARHHLICISYYRLRAYWLPFEVPAAAGDHAFRPGTSFQDVLALYIFDRQLRLLVMDAVERVEVAFRAGWAHGLAVNHGSHGYLKPELYDDLRHFQVAVDNLHDDFQRSRDTFAEHYRQTYDDPELPPVWMAAEIMSFGQLSKWIDNLKFRSDRQAIARLFGLDEKVLVSFAHHMSYVRNICAHHGRLWNRRMVVKMRVPKAPISVGASMKDAPESLLYNTLTMLEHLMTVISPGSGWRKRVVDLVDSCPLAQPSAMGFPEDWRRRPAWRVD
ncbi:Abi family protein [Rubellimicrobium rubrum]|uniref:Abi family protein n=1 Tax=Rubellimicrobium rubrum TaxID=2585369 RepID=A0A5C4MT44_9RHOB|nr:Abi family protein [Rubellimicrobium rubrum]TNC49035.1 Abi family protein [Rubellimicrobium rubrum]